MDNIQSFSGAVRQRLKSVFGETGGDNLYKKYFDILPPNYIELSCEENIFLDICIMQTLSPSNPVAVNLIKINKDHSESFHLRLFQHNYVTALSDILPILDNMNFRAISQISYEIRDNDVTIWVSDYTIVCPNEFAQNFDELKDPCQDGLVNILNGGYENDGFNKIMFVIGCTCREVNIFRAYAKYIQQIRMRFSQQYLQDTLHKNANIARLLLNYFMVKHDPALQDVYPATKELLDTNLKSELDKVNGIDEDRILRQFWKLIQATKRTNYFQKDKLGQSFDYLSFKFKSDEVPDLPLPKPLYEILIYSKQFEGIHLRADKVARGGVRWSDRREDYRTEVLALMKAQTIKNSVIIPSGAKGGFVLKQLRENATRDETQTEAIACYRQFIAGLLNLTDNIINAEVIKPLDVVCYDGDDSYLVVAADKGTASYSDIANAIAIEYGFWLGDAFASGGSTGYDHKKLGITARGSWESIKRHFRELDINLTTHTPTVVGIGDMSGDVFGNGMIYTNRICLVSAFDHRHIFIDPSPDIDVSFKERLRLFELSHSSWDDYNKLLISKGGGVYSRTLKSIPLSRECQNLLGINDEALSPSELIQAILRIKVDLLYNGGIGTYVKASHESHEDVSDRANEFCRINADELQCKVVSEGGNLGLTQLARIEFSLRGGLITADFIDNSAGVTCSDHEVNLKIALDKKVASQEMIYQKRNDILNQLSDSVAELVLKQNYYQALVLSFSSNHATAYLDLYQTHIRKLESCIGLSRSVEFLPDDKKISDRKASGLGLLRPELAVLLSYTKMHVKNEVLKSTLPENIFFKTTLKSAFPSLAHEFLSSEISTHPLRREIISTQLSNQMINRMGITFPFRVERESGATIPDVAIAFMISIHIYDLDEVYAQIESLDDVVSSKLQYEILHSLRQLVSLSTRWFLRNNRINADIEKTINHYQKSMRLLVSIIPNLVVGQTRQNHTLLFEKFVSAGLNSPAANMLSISRVLYSALNISEVATTHDFDLVNTAKIFFAVGGRFNLVWFRDWLANDNREGSQNSMARLTLRDALDVLQRRITILIMQYSGYHENIYDSIEGWIDAHPLIFNRCEKIVRSVQDSQYLDYTALFIALSELLNGIDSEGKIEKIHQLAMLDSITNLPNRNFLLDSFHIYADRAVQNNTIFAVVFIDIDNFKGINDTHGHEIGDGVLRTLSDQVRRCIREQDILARHGGDEFILVLASIKSKENVSDILDRILHQFQRPLGVNGIEINVTLSFGVSLYPYNGTTASQLIKYADEAMYRSKVNGKNQYTFSVSEV